MYILFPLWQPKLNLCSLKITKQVNKSTDHNINIDKILKICKKQIFLESAWIRILAIFSHDKLNFLTHVLIVNFFALGPVYSLACLKQIMIKDF